jgi:hypothetical protein
MQSIGGNNDGTYTLYMFSFTPRTLGLACRPCSGPRFRRCLGWHIASLAPPHRFLPHRDVCTLLEWELSWGTKFMMRAFAESVGNTLNYSTNLLLISSYTPLNIQVPTAGNTSPSQSFVLRHSREFILTCSACIENQNPGAESNDAKLAVSFNGGKLKIGIEQDKMKGVPELGVAPQPIQYSHEKKRDGVLGLLRFRRLSLVA